MAQMFLAPSEGKVMKASMKSVLPLGTTLIVMLTLLKYIPRLLKLVRQQLPKKEIKYKIFGIRICSITFLALEVHTSPESLSSLGWWSLFFIAPRRRVIYICIFSYEILE